MTGSPFDHMGTPDAEALVTRQQAERTARLAKIRAFAAETESLPDAFVEALEQDRDAAMGFALQFPSRVDARIRAVYELLGFAEALGVVALAYPDGSRARLVASRIAAAVKRHGITWDEVVAESRKVGA